MASGATETVEVLPGRLYWSCVRVTPSDTADGHFFSTDDLLIYDPYFGDFGPLNVSQLCRYCRMLNQKLSDSSKANKKVVHCCRPQHDTRANSVLLLSAWQMLYNDKSPEEAWEPFAGLRPALCPYRDASMGQPLFNLTVLHCLTGLRKARELGWFNADKFDVKAYEYYERVENGDFNWIVPGKFLAFSGPTQTPIAYVDGVKTNTPETYYEYFRANHVTGIVRFNNKVYDRKKFIDAGFNHYDLYFPDGSNPPDAIIKRFLDIAEAEPGALAIHCKAGLGRTGTLISLYIMKHFKLTMTEVLGWLRLCRPGSVIGPQQTFLEDMQNRMWREGELHRKNGGTASAAADSMSQLSLKADGPSAGSSPVAGRLSSASPGSKSPNASPTPMRPKGGFSIAGIHVGGSRSSSPSRNSGTSSPVKTKPGIFSKR
uniref:protein-tyrosine-phosphatase n=2 Tax=Chrysotila carterae TaxID=13221 RepID=A0A6S9SCY9_CHRCT|mmetsp:Transcript_54126/g.118024  ORF Transcript_54126/g.118024 Transcript_54126/m.118024 type:complete len:429 (-) Transcript_54126:439-1725(-)